MVTSPFYFMKEYDSFKGLSFSPRVDTNYTLGTSATSYTYKDNPQTGSSLGGTVVPFNSGDFSVKTFRDSYRLSVSMSAENAIKYRSYGSTILNGQKIKAGTYIMLELHGSGSMFVANEDTMAIQSSPDIEMLYPLGDKALINYGNVIHPFFRVIKFINDHEPVLRTNTTFQLMDGRKVPNYVADFDRLSYTVGSEEHKSDSFLATCTYSASDVRPVIHKDLTKFESSGDWLVKDDLTYYENSTSEYPNTAGVYFYMEWNKTQKTGLGLTSTFRMRIVTLPEVSSSGMNFLPDDKQLLGFEAFGQINSAGVYLKRIHDFSATSYTTGYEHIDKLKFVPTKRPFNSNLIHSITYTRFSEGTVRVFGESSFEWDLIFSIGGGLPDFPDWQDTSSGLQPKLAFFQLIQTPDVLSGGFPSETYKCDLTFIMNDSSVVNDSITNQHNWCMIPLNGRTVKSVSGTLNNKGSSWDMDTTSVQLVYFL